MLTAFNYGTCLLDNNLKVTHFAVTHCARTLPKKEVEISLSPKKSFHESEYFEIDFLKNENLFEKTGVALLVESTKIENA